VGVRGTLDFGVRRHKKPRNKDLTYYGEQEIRRRFTDQEEREERHCVKQTQEMSF